MLATSYRLYGVLVLAVAPLVLLTVRAFSDTGVSAGGDSESVPPLISWDQFQSEAAARVTAAKAHSDADLSDPSGFDGSDVSESSVTLAYEVAGALGQAEQAGRSKDLATVTQARDLLSGLVKRKGKEVRALQPAGAGGSLADSLLARGEATDRHAVWLEQRKEVAAALKAAGDAILAGPEGKGEAKCISLLDGVVRSKPGGPVGAADDSEPGDSLTVEEAGSIEALRDRAVYRAAFFKLRDAPPGAKAGSKDHERYVISWKAFLSTYAERGAAGDRESGFLAEAATLLDDSELAMLRAVALEQTDVGELSRAISDWLEEAETRSKGDERQAARELFFDWVERSVPAAPSPPPGVSGVLEAVTAPAGKRKFGLFRKVPQTAAQYRWWSSKAAERSLPKGENSFNLEGVPVEPLYLAVASDYRRLREQFVGGGYMIPAESERFGAACRELSGRLGEYHARFFENSLDIDEATRDWAGAFDQAADVADQLAKAARESDILERLSGGN